MSEAIGVGVVGAGAIGLRCPLAHLSIEDVQDRVRLAALCDPFPGRARAAAERFGVPAAYLRFEELLDDPNVDAVTLCSPIGLHYEQGMAAIRAGKHVHFNKTMAIRAAECTEMMNLAAEKGVKLVASPGMMLHPYNRRIRGKLLAGDLGQVLWAICGGGPGTYHLDEESRQGDDVLSNVDPTWYFRRPGGGPMWDVIVYHLHTLTGLLGPAKRLTAMSGLALKERQWRGKTIQCDMDDSTFIILDFGRSLFAIVFGAVTGGVTVRFQPTIFGTKGTIRGTDFNGEEMRIEGDHQPHVVGPHAKMPESHVFEDLMQLVDWIREDKPSIVTTEHARHVIEIIEKAYEVARTGKAAELTTTFEPLGADEC
jgi:predicted dehydrogenase